jgi:hypothetical protein
LHRHAWNMLNNKNEIERTFQTEEIR